VLSRQPTCKVCLYNVTRQPAAPALGGFLLAQAGKTGSAKHRWFKFVARHTIWRNGVAAMILKLTTNDKASIWVNLSRILQMTLIDAQDGDPKTQIVMDNGAVICVFETPDDIAQWTKIC
jgi:hypothetical protein